MSVNDPSNFPDLSNIRPFTLDMDPTTGRVTRITAEDHEWAAAREAARQINADSEAAGLLTPDRIRDLMTARIAESTARFEEERRAATSAKETQPSAEHADIPSCLKAFDAYARRKIEFSRWSENTLTHTHAPSIRVFCELLTSTPVDQNEDPQTPPADFSLRELTRSRMKLFIDEFRSLPARQGRRHVNARLLLKQGGPKQSLQNFFKCLSHIAPFVQHCVKQKWVSQDVLDEIREVQGEDNDKSRQAEKMKRLAAGQDAHDGYVAFSESDLQRMFAPALYVSQVRGRPDRTDTPDRRARRYWIPLIGLYTGMRLAEISQLAASDFVVNDGVVCINVSPGRTVNDLSATRIKTVASLRSVPVHPELIRLGLLEYVKSCRDIGREWLWKGLKWRDKEGFGKYPGRDFGDLTKAAGVYVRRRKVFHSFRSTFHQALQKVPLEGVLIDLLLGHEVEETRFKNYARREDGTRAYPYEHVLSICKKVHFELPVPTWPEIQKTAA